MPLNRSVLFVPGDKPRAIEKASGLPCDAIILDLEDAVAPEHKLQARNAVREALRGSLRGRRVAVRINDLSTPWGDDDLQMLLNIGPAAIVLPKAQDPTVVKSLSLGIPLWLMIETPLGVLRAEQLAAVPGAQALIMGTSDLVRDLRARHTPDRENLTYALGRVVTCARAHGLLALDAVHLDFRDAAGFEAACRQGRDFGFDGKTLIHPDQIDLANRVFAPSPDEVAQAQALLAAWDAARAEGKSVAVFQGRLVESLHAHEAHEVLRVARDAGLLD